MGKAVGSILVLGKGTAGLVAATILKKRLGRNTEVTIVYSKSKDIIGVGEGSTPEFQNYLDYLGIPYRDIIKECGATFKSGIKFEDWNSERGSYFHGVPEELSHTCGEYLNYLASRVSEGLPLSRQDNLDNLVNADFLHTDRPPFTQLHFDSYKLNIYLTKVALGMGITIVEDDVEQVVISDSGDIQKVVGKGSSYVYDFYVDAAGFNKPLISALGGTWRSFSKYLKMDSAITFPTFKDEGLNLWTLAKAMKSGWLFRIPTQGRYGNGYIFSSAHTDGKQAKKEVEEYLGYSIEVGKTFKFDPGCLENSWIKNCCAVGLSAVFVEPLEASSIGTTIQQVFMLMHRLPNYTEEAITKYNQSYTDVVDNTRDFIALHYVSDREDSPFWAAQKEVPLPPSLRSRLELWKSSLPISEDFMGSSGYSLFGASNYLYILEGLGLLDRDQVSKELGLSGEQVIGDTYEYSRYLNSLFKEIEYLEHSEFIYKLKKQ